MTAKTAVGLARCGGTPHPHSIPFLASWTARRTGSLLERRWPRRSVSELLLSHHNITSTPPVTLAQVPTARALHGGAAVLCFVALRRRTCSNAGVDAPPASTTCMFLPPPLLPPLPPQHTGRPSRMVSVCRSRYCLLFELKIRGGNQQPQNSGSSGRRHGQAAA